MGWMGWIQKKGEVWPALIQLDRPVGSRASLPPGGLPPLISTDYKKRAYCSVSGGKLVSYWLRIPQGYTLKYLVYVNYGKQV